MFSYTHGTLMKQKNYLELYKPKSSLIENTLEGDFDERYTNTPNIWKNTGGT